MGLSNKANTYIGIITAGGVTVLLYSVYVTFLTTDPGWVVLALLTAVGSLFPVYLPRFKGKDRGVVLTVSTVFIFTGILAYGPAVATLLSAVEACVSSCRSRRSINTIQKVLFNVFHLPLVTFSVAHLFYAIYPHPIPLDPSIRHNLPALFLGLGFCSTLYFFLNSGAISLAISLFTGQPLRATWQESFLATSLTNFAEACAAVVVFINLPHTALLALGVALPTTTVIYYAYSMNQARIREANSHLEQLHELYHSTIEALAMAVDAKDQVTHGHIYRVQAVVFCLAKYCGMNQESDLEGLRAAALLHDIGKLATPDYILNKPGTLTDSEMETMKAHAAMGADILASVPFPYPVVPYVRHHHEKWDGTGYPDGLEGEEIPLGGRILAIADCYDALRSDRPYRSRLSREATLNYIKSEANKSFDPRIVDQLILHIEEIESQVTALEHGMITAQRQAAQPRPLGQMGPRAIVNTVFHDIASAHREVQALHEISQAVGRLLTVTETLTLLADKISNLVPYSACCVYLNNSSNDKLIPYHASGKCSEKLSQLEVKIGEGVTGWVAANQRPLVNVSSAPELRHDLELRTTLKSCLAVPLMMDHSVVGVITLYGDDRNAFRPKHLRLVENVAPHAATAINNAIIYEETKEDAYTDLLTGLPNLRYLKVFVEQELKRAERSQYPVTLVMMDLDIFKTINDELGHKAGDRVLIEISHVLRNQMRKSDTCIRHGGDEFVGVLPGVEKEDADSIVRKLQAAVDSHTMVLDGGRTSFRIGISLGTATFPDDGERLDQLLAVADQAMYRNKVSRANQRKQTAELIRFDSAVTM